MTDNVFAADTLRHLWTQGWFLDLERLSNQVIKLYTKFYGKLNIPREA